MDRQATAISCRRHGCLCAALSLISLVAAQRAYSAPAAATSIPHCFSFHDQFVCLAISLPRIESEARLQPGSATALPLPPEVGRAGAVGLVVDVDAAGEVLDVSIERSSKVRVLDRAAVAHARTLRYLPAIQAGQPIVSRLRVELVFEEPGSSQ